ncbi:MAG TPA: AURKAIP1/COX24 domain-containing protein [Opitutaceae bacterium]|nr:AURKAIP1/COX24 domain-containing protein [Opitutaceae bacterium]
MRASPVPRARCAKPKISFTGWGKGRTVRASPEIMGNLKKKRRLKMNKHKRRKRLKAHRHQKRTWQR